MTSPYVGEVRMFGGNFAPAGWALCSGQLLPISENSALFNLIGTTYGGDGVTNFALPDLRGRFPTHQGTGAGQTVLPGQVGGTETVTLTTSQLPVHTHPSSGSSTATSQSPSKSAPAAWTESQYSTADPTAAQLLPIAVSNTGGNAPHENRSPYLGISFIIALNGIYPSQS
jgi:microcystin-dependent protein